MKIFVLIESDWNLKIVAPDYKQIAAYVLIESDWNLKQEEIKNGYRRIQY